MKTQFTLSLLLIFSVLPVEAQTVSSPSSIPSPTSTAAVQQPTYIEYPQKTGLGLNHPFNCLTAAYTFEISCNTAYNQTKSEWLKYCGTLQSDAKSVCINELNAYENDCEAETKTFLDNCLAL